MTRRTSATASPTRHAARRAAKSLLAILALLLFAAGAARANTYYIDYATGSNSNAGTSKSAPWKSHPYMQTAASCTGTGSAPAYTHAAGDTFIFKGGVTWPGSCFPMSISNGGSSNTVRDTYTVDQTWYTGGSFTKPIFAGQNVAMDGMVHVNASNVTLSYLDIGGWQVTTVNGALSNCDQATIIISTGNSNVTADHMYLHDWLVAAIPAHANGVVHGITSGGMCLQQYAWNNNTLSNSEVSDAANMYGGNQISVGSCGANIGLWYDNCHDLYEGIVGHEAVHDTEMNHISWPCSGSSCGADVMGFSGSSHTNLIESGTGWMDGPVYNNYLHDSGVFGEVIDECMSDPVYNNVISNVANIPIRFQTCGADTTSTITYVYNNTVNELQCINRSGGCPYTAIQYSSGDLSKLGKVYGQNNITIGSSTNLSGASGSVVSNNRVMTSTEAASYGFIASNKFSPSSADPNTVAQGVNLTSSCSGLLSALCQDATGTPWFGGAYKTRPTGSTAWDLGAFQGQGGSTGPPAISINSPSPGAVSGSANLTATCTPQGSATVSSIQFTIDANNFGAAGTSSPYTLSWNTLTAANSTHTISAVCTDSNSQTATAAAVTVTVSNSMPGCFVSGSNSNWNAYQSFTAQTGTFTATFTATPNTNNQDSVIALSQSPMTAYSQGAALVRFNSSGQIDVYKGSLGGYTADNVVNYSAGTTYAFTFTVNISAGTYTAVLTSPSSVTLATGYTFRTTAPAASLGFINAVSDNTTPDTAQVCNFQIGSTASLTFSPASLNLGNVTVGANTAQTITATTSGGAVNFTSVAISGSSDFTIASNSCTGSIPISCATQIQFAPTTAAPETATVAYTDDATGSPQTVAVSGTGVPATPTLTINPASLNFGGVQLHVTSSSGPIVLTITSGPVTFTGTPALSGTNAADFVLASNTCTATVSAGTSCQTVVSFTPSLVAPESATLTFTDTATTSPQSIPLTGTGFLAPHPPTAVQSTVN